MTNKQIDIEKTSLVIKPAIWIGSMVSTIMVVWYVFFTLFSITTSIRDNTGGIKNLKEKHEKINENTKELKNSIRSLELNNQEFQIEFVKLKSQLNTIEANILRIYSEVKKKD